MTQERKVLFATLPAEQSTQGSHIETLLGVYQEEGDRPLDPHEMFETGHELLDLFGRAFNDNLEYLQAAGMTPTAMVPQSGLHKRKGTKEEVHCSIGSNNFSIASHADDRHRNVTYYWDRINPKTEEKSFETLEVDVVWQETSEYSQRIRYEHGFGERSGGDVANRNTLSALNNAVEFYQRVLTVHSQGTSVSSLLQKQAPQE